jgi:chemotaxis response regulator CheB
MAVSHRDPNSLGVLLIGFSPVVREGLQAILTKDDAIEVIGDAPGRKLSSRSGERANGGGPYAWC